jgi:hypothetical protein
MSYLIQVEAEDVSNHQGQSKAHWKWRKQAVPKFGDKQVSLQGAKEDDKIVIHGLDLWVIFKTL